MKRIVLFLLVACGCMTAAAQEPVAGSGAEVVARLVDRYELRPTSNAYYFLKLDTRTGAVWQIEWSQRMTDCRQTPVSAVPEPLSEEAPNGRFELYPTQFGSVFLLQDKIDGRTWLLQWHPNPDKVRLEIITR